MSPVEVALRSGVRACLKGELRTVWLGEAGQAHDVDAARLRGGDLVLASGRVVT